jgi:hypothetical protein
MISSIQPRCREILESDIEAIGTLLTGGFTRRKREYWMRGLRYQSKRSIPPDVPRYGFLLESISGSVVGCLLLIYSNRLYGGATSIFCNVSSWYVDPQFRNYAPLLASIAQRRKDVTYFNVTPDVSTWPIIEAQGFKPYCRGLCISIPVLSRAERGVNVEVIRCDTKLIKGLPESDLAMLKRHAECGCLCLVCHSPEGTLPFIFLSLPKRYGFIAMPAMQLGYCRNISDYVRYAGTLGRFLLQQGKPIVLLDANGPMAGLVGIYTERRGRKYFKGPSQPRLGDLSDTELVIFGL